MPDMPGRQIQAQILRILEASREPSVESESAQFPRGEATADEANASLPEPLKAREIDVLALVAAGKSNKEIARYLGIGVDTVKWYLKAIYGKLGVNRRLQAISEARRLRLID
jgi:DNA-binding CsgD family transcriptional regulator